MGKLFNNPKDSYTNKNGRIAFKQDQNQTYKTKPKEQAAKCRTKHLQQRNIQMFEQDSTKNATYDNIL